MDLYVVFIVAISLSMDAFSLSLAYGTINLLKREMLFLSIIVGLFHFFMPLIGLCVGNTITKTIIISPNIIASIVLSFIGFNLIRESFEKNSTIKKMKIFESFMFGFAVSIDSFSAGIGLNNISHRYIICSLTFSLSSFIFTYLGLILGKEANQFLGKISTLIGGITLIAIGLIYLL